MLIDYLFILILRISLYNETEVGWCCVILSMHRGLFVQSCVYIMCNSNVTNIIFPVGLLQILIVLTNIHITTEYLIESGETFWYTHSCISDMIITFVFSHFEMALKSVVNIMRRKMLQFWILSALHRNFTFLID